MNSTELIFSLFEGMNQKRLESLEPVVADNAVFHFPKTAPVEGKKRILTFLKVLFRKYPNLTFTLGRTVCSEHLAAVEWTNRGDGKNGESYQNAGVTFIEVADGQIIYISDTFKDTEKF